MTIRPISAADNQALAAIIRKILKEFGANKPGTVFFDPTTDDLFQLFLTPESAYFVAEVDENRRRFGCFSNTRIATGML